MSDARALLRARKAATGSSSSSLSTQSKPLRPSAIRAAAKLEEKTAAAAKKRSATTTDEGAKKRKTVGGAESKASSSSGGGVPEGFFADPSKTLLALGQDSDSDEEEEGPTPAPAAVASSSSTAPAPATSAVDDEFDSFLSSIVSAQAPPASAPEPTAPVSPPALSRATITAEPVRLKAEPQKETVEEDAGAIRRKKELEEKEEIMSRLEEEERAQ